MNIAEQLKSAHTVIDHHSNKMLVDTSSLIDDAELVGEVNQDWYNETTEFEFADGSVLIVCNSEASTYGSR